MTRADPVGWARRRSPLEWLALAAGVGVFLHLGWDDALWDARLQVLLHLIGVGAIAGVAVAASRGVPMPRTPLDLPLLALLLAFTIATASAVNVGMSLRALASIFAFAAMLPVALLAVRHRPTWVGLIASVPVLLHAVPILVALVARRIEWVAVGAPGLPPLRLPGEVTPFGSVAVPPFVIVPAWALAGLIEPPALRRVVRTGLVIVGIPLVILSGSRSAWLAIGVALAVGVVPWAWRQRHRLDARRRPTVRGALVGIGALAASVLALVLVLPRITAVTSLLYRGALWKDTLVAWAGDPVSGIGPGFMPWARQAAAEDFTFPVRQPHSHNLPLGVLGDAGVLGLVAGVVVVGTLLLAAGPWRSRTALGRTAGIVLIGLGVGALFEDLTFLPGFDLLVIGLIAVALVDANVVRWLPVTLAPRRKIAMVGVGAGAIVLVVGTVVSDAGAVAYRMGIDSARAGDWPEATAWLRTSVEVDPWHPAGPAALAVAADAVDDDRLALGAAAAATERSPGDATAWTNRALLCERAGDDGCARDAAERATATARYLAPEALNAALVLDRIGEASSADAAYRVSLLTQPATAFAAAWPREVSVGDPAIPEISDASWELNVLLARHATDERIEPKDFTDAAVRALAHAVRGEEREAREWIARGLEERPDDIRTHDINVILRDHWGEPIQEATRVASVVRGNPFPTRDLEVVPPAATRDIAAFREYPRDGFVSSARRLATQPPFPWTLGSILP